MEEQKRPQGMDKFRIIGFVTTIVSYFIIKYGIVARWYGAEDTNNFFYSIGLILGCVFVGRAVESWLRSRNEK